MLRAQLMVTVAAALSLVVALLVVPLLTGDSPVQLQSILAGTLGAWVAVIASIHPISVTAKAGATMAAAGALVGMAIRLTIAIAFIVVASFTDKLAVQPVALAIVIAYLAMLAVETAVVGRFVWQLDDGHASPLPPAVTAMEKCA